MLCPEFYSLRDSCHARASSTDCRTSGSSRFTSCCSDEVREHIASEKIHPVERGADWLLERAGFIGPNTHAWAYGCVASRGVEAVRVLHGLLSLGNKHPSHLIERACDTAHANGCYRLATLRELIRRDGAKQQQFEFLDKHPIIRNLSEYGSIIRVDFRKEATSR